MIVCYQHQSQSSWTWSNSEPVKLGLTIFKSDRSEIGRVAVLRYDLPVELDISSNRNPTRPANITTQGSIL